MTLSYKHMLSNQTAEQVGATAGAEIGRLFPQLGEVRFESYWNGMMDMSPHRFPGVHELAPGLFTAVGFSGRGVPTATAVGRELARMIAAHDAEAMAMPLTALPRARFGRLVEAAVRQIYVPFHYNFGRFF